MVSNWNVLALNFVGNILLSYPPSSPFIHDGWVYIGATDPKLVISSVDMVCFVFFSFLLISFQYLYWRFNHFLLPLGYGYLTLFLLYFPHQLGLCPMQEPSYLGKIDLVSIWFRMVLTQMITWVYKDSLTLRYPPNINIWLVMFSRHVLTSRRENNMSKFVENNALLGLLDKLW